jgi:DNA-binding transcriptional MerR regulator
MSEVRKVDKKYFKIEDVAIKTGLTKRTLRYYEDIELVKPSRTEAGYRLYTEEDIKLVEKIKDLRTTLGFSLGEVKYALYIENRLQYVFSNPEAKNAIDIEETIKATESQIEAISDKKKALERVKSKYEEILSKLHTLNDTIEEE